MAKQKQSIKSAAKIRKKIWVEIIAPEIFNKMFVGETHVHEPEEAIGKTVTINLMVLTNDPKKQYAEMQFEVTGIQDGKAVTKLKSYSMAASTIKRLLRRRNDKIADSFIFVTADAKRIRLKYVLLSKSPTSASVRADLRTETRILLSRTIRKITFETLIRDIVSYKFQSFIRDDISRIFPLQSCEIKYIGSESVKQAEKTYDPVAESDYVEHAESRKKIKPMEKAVKKETEKENAEETKETISDEKKEETQESSEETMDAETEKGEE